MISTRRLRHTTLQALLNGSTVVHADTITSSEHFSVRDAGGESIVVEWTGGQVQVYTDGNDNGKTGFGVMTNEYVLK